MESSVLDSARIAIGWGSTTFIHNASQRTGFAEKDGFMNGIIRHGWAGR
jgi:hypothetical protein